MGESKKDASELDFDRKLKVEFHGTKVTSDAGVLVQRELDKPVLQLRDSLAFGKEVFLGMAKL